MVPPVAKDYFLKPGTVVLHILVNLLRERVPNGPIRGALAHSGLSGPHAFIQVDTKGLLTNRSALGNYLSVPEYLPQKQVQALINLQSYHEEILMVDELGHKVAKHLPYEMWMQVTHHDLMIHLIQTKKRKVEREKADITAM